MTIHTANTYYINGPLLDAHTLLTTNQFNNGLDVDVQFAKQFVLFASTAYVFEVLGLCVLAFMLFGLPTPSSSMDNSDTFDWKQADKTGN
jgi:hypothetical protein